MAKKDDLTIFLRAQDKTKKAFASVGTNIKKLKSLLGPVVKGFAAITAGVGLVGAALIKTFRSNAPYIDALGKTADKLGVTTEKLQAYRDAAEFAGIGNASLDTSFQRFIRRLGTAATGTGATNKELIKLGINAKELAAQGPAQAFETILDKIKAVESQTERVRLAFAFFGKEGVDLVRLTTDAISKSEMQMDALGLSISRIDSARVEMANDAIKRLGDISDGVGRRITANMSGAVTVLTDRIIGAASSFLGLRKSSTNASETILIGVGKVVDAFRLFLTSIDLIRIGFTKLSIGVLKFGQDVSSALSDKLLGGLAKFDNQLGVFAQGMIDAGAGTGVFSEKINELDKDLLAINTRIRDRASGGSFTDALLGDLAAVDAQAKTTAAELERLRTLSPTGVGDTSSLVGSGEAANEAYKVTSEQLKLFTVDTDAAAASSEALKTVMGNTASALGTLANSFAKTRSQARTFVAIQQALAVVSAYSAATQALADITSPTPFQKFAAYSSVLAQGLAAVAAIKRAGASIGASGGASVSTVDTSASSSSTSTSATVQSQNDSSQPQGDLVINLSGRGRLSSDIVEEIGQELVRSGRFRNVRVA